MTTLSAGTSPAPLVSPFPYFGGKAQVAEEVWKRFGNPSNYVEPFAGSLAVLLGRPNAHQWWSRIESVNDLDGNIANWFRAVTADPATVAHYASQPVNEADLTSRHLWLVQNATGLRMRLMSDPDYCDPKAAGWWVWGICCWVGGEWCTGLGPHTGSDEPSRTNGGTAPGVYRKIPMMSGAHGGKGIHRPPDITSATPRLSSVVPDVSGHMETTLTEQFEALANRLRRVRVACGSWERVLGNVAQPLAGHTTAVFLDPPYDPQERRGDLYAVGDGIRRETGEALDLGAAYVPDDSVHALARSWALERSEDSDFKIAYCSYSTPSEDALFEHAGWTPYRWSAKGGYGLSANNKARDNKDREIIWFSPSCTLDDLQGSLFDNHGA